VKNWKLLKKMLASADNIRFGDLVTLVEAFGFQLQRVNGSHCIYSHPDMSALLNLQNLKGKAKPYQIRQFLKLLEEYGLDMEDGK